MEQLREELAASQARLADEVAVREVLGVGRGKETTAASPKPKAQEITAQQALLQAWATPTKRRDSPMSRRAAARSSPATVE